MLGDPIRKLGDLLFRRINVRLTRADVRPEWAYVLELTMAAASATAFLNGMPWAGLTLLAFHGFFDYLDGGLRRARGQGNQRPQWLGMDAHAVVDKASEVILFAGLASRGWVDWPLGVLAAVSSLGVTIVGGTAKKWLDVDPSRALFDRTDRLFVLLVAGTFRAFDLALALVCAMNGIILLQRAAYMLLAVQTRDRAP